MADELDPVVLIFGGGVNRRRRPFDIDPQECYDGQNFDLDHQFSALHRRNAFQLLGTAPNAEAIRGYAQLVQRNGTITTLIQAGGNIYSWNGTTTFTLVGTCSPTSRLRGARDQTSDLDQLVIITDLEKATVVQQWNGTALSAFSHNLSSPLYAKFCRIQNERIYFGNVQSGTNTPHVLLGSALSDIHTLTVNNRPSSTLSEADPFFIPTPDLKDINGLEVAFGQFLISTRKGKLHVLSGLSAQDFTLDSFFAGSEASGDEAIVNIGNDLLLGRPGGIDTLSGVTQFGDVENDDVSLWIQPLIESITDWAFAYDRTLQKAYCFPDNQDLCWVLHKSVLNDGKFSPWSKWVTSHSATFQPSCVLQIVDPSSQLDAVFMGDSTGRIFKLEGLTAQDGGTTSIELNRRSIIYQLPGDEIFDIEGTITYLKSFAATITLTFEYGGIAVFDQDITVTIPAGTGVAVYNGPAYYNGPYYYNVGFAGRLTRRKFSAAGAAVFVQVKVTVTSDADIEIHQVVLNFKSASET